MIIPIVTMAPIAIQKTAFFRLGTVGGCGGTELGKGEGGGGDIGVGVCGDGGNLGSGESGVPGII
jgi:hypothetical protein